MIEIKEDKSIRSSSSRKLAHTNLHGARPQSVWCCVCMWLCMVFCGCCTYAIESRSSRCGRQRGGFILGNMTPPIAKARAYASERAPRSAFGPAKNAASIWANGPGFVGSLFSTHTYKQPSSQYRHDRLAVRLVARANAERHRIVSLFDEIGV